VIEVLEEAGIEADLITGTSMGSIIGGLYATGYSTEMLRGVAQEVDWDRLFSDAPERRNLPVERKSEEGRVLFGLPIVDGRPRLPSAFVQGQRISQLLTALTWNAHDVTDFKQLPLPFTAVATDAETGEAVALDGGYLPEAMRASIAIPSVFAPVETDGRFLIDGGVSRNLPAVDAVNLGAEIIICSDVTEPLKGADSLQTLVDILAQTIAFRTVERRDEQLELCNAVISPDIDGIAATDFDRAEEIIQRGRAAAVRVLTEARHPSLLPVRTSAAAQPARTEPARASFDSVYVERVVVTGLEGTPESTVLESLDLDTPAWMRPRVVEEAISRVYDTGLFQRVGYRLEPVASNPEGGGRDRLLHVRVKDQSRDWLGASYRYEGRYKASILATAAVRNLLPGTTLLADLRLGEQTRLAADFTRRWGWGVGPLVGLSLDLKRQPFDIFVDDTRVAEPRVKVGALAGFLGLGLGYDMALGLRIKLETYDSDDVELAEDWSGGSNTFYTLAGLFRVDTFDRATFPRSGVGIQLKAEWADEAIGSGATFSHHLADMRGAVPVGRRVSLGGRLTLGYSDGPDLPSHYRFFIGGANEFHLYPDRNFPFVGLRVQERRGRHLQGVRLGMQWEFVSNFFALARLEAAALPEEWRIDADDFFGGWGFGAGARSRFGSAKLMVTGRGSGPRVEIDVGYPF
jgi:NTE family protein